MFFWKKNEEVILEFFTHIPSVYEFFKIKPSTFHFPGWWKNLPIDKCPVGKIRNDFTGTNMKHCRGFIDLYKHILTLPMWAELEIKIEDNNFKWISNSGMDITQHHPEQYQGLHSDYNFFHLKINTPWALYNKKSKVDIMLIDNNLHKPSPLFTVVPGVLKGDQRHQINVNLFGQSTQQPRVVNYSFNEPLVHLVPITDKKVKLKYHLIDIKEYNNLFRQACFSNINRKDVVAKKIQEAADAYNKTLESSN